MGASDLGSPQSLNLFAYVGNNPIDFIDPTGLLCYWVGGSEGRSPYLDCGSDNDTGGRPPDRPGPPTKCVGDSCGGSGPDPTPPNTRSNLEQAIDYCSRLLFDVALTVFSPTSEGKSGGASFQTLDGRGVKEYDQSYRNWRQIFGYVEEFSVLNDVTSYSTKDLTDKETLKNGFVVVGKTAWNSGIAGIYKLPFTSKSGKTVQAATNLNFTASDSGNFGEAYLGVSQYTWNQIHELGNSLAIITGTQFSKFGSRKVDTDSGYAFESCDKGRFTYLQIFGR